MKAWMLVAALTVASGLPAYAAGGDLLARAASINPGLHAYSASMHADVHLTTFPFLAAKIEGTLYHKDPSQNKLVISSGLPMAAEGFNKLYAQIPSPSDWNASYDVKPGPDDGTSASFTLVPKKKGNVDHIDVKLDDKNATVTYMRWSYANGGYAEMTNKYKEVKGNTVVGTQTAHVQEPGYSADISSTLDNYTFNPTLSDDLFTK